MKRWILPLLAAALLLSACGTQPAAPEESSPAPSPAVSSPAPPAPVPEEPAEPEELIPIDPLLFEPESNCYTLLDNEELRFELLFTRSIADGGTMILYRAENRCEEELRVEVSDVLLNGSVRVGNEETITVPAGEKRQSAYHPALDQSCAWIGCENLRSYAASLRLTRGAEKSGEPIPCSAVFPEGIRLSLSYERFREGRADRQVLKADGQVCIALLGCGRLCGDYGSDCLRGYLWIENRGEEPIPVALSGLAVNGVNLPFSARSREALQPKTSCLLEFRAEAADFDLAEIRSLGSLSLQILSSPEKNSGGSMAAAGGTWYPVALAVSGQAEHSAAQGTVLYDDGLLQLSLVSAELRASGREDVVEAVYTLYAVNRRTDGVSLYFSEPLVKGEPYRSAVTDTAYIDKKNTRFGPQSEGYLVLSLDLPADGAGETAPGFSFLLQVRSQGGDSIFYAIPERIRINETEEETP